MIDLDHLEALARAATPGPWEAMECSRAREYTSTVRAPEQSLDCCRDVAYLADYREFQNCRYIAAANPATVLALIERVRELERQRKVLTGAWLAATYDSSDDIVEELTADFGDRWPDWRSWAEGGE